MTVLGFDTSNYTTSAAVFDGTDGFNCSRLLNVKDGQIGLRQSDALFSHVQRLPEIADQLRRMAGFRTVDAVAASTRPRAVEGSYMPCFLAGASQGKTMAALLGLPFFEISHQQGHLAAAAWSAGRMDLLEGPFLCWHLSGGTTELLYINPGVLPLPQRIGGTADLSAGQLIDRTGRMLGISFPAGKELDRLAGADETIKPFLARSQGLEFSFSGLENKADQLKKQDASDQEIASFIIRSVCIAVQQITKLAQKEYPGLPVLFSGGVASNSMLRRTMQGCIFAQPQYATDNALGTAILGWRLLEDS